ncbi:MAG: HU family DNA-binding protein [Tunicatimonas sp.]
MSVPFNVVSKHNPQQPKAAKKFYAVAQSTGEAGFRQMAKEIAEITTVSVPDAVAVLESLVMIIPRHIEKGEIIRLGELGSLRLTVNSEGSDTAEEVNASKIKKANYRFTPGDELQQTLKILKYARVKSAEPTPTPAAG